MGAEFYIAQGISILTGILAAVMMQLKKMKVILLFQLAVNLLTALTYILLGGLSGGGICLIAILQSAVMFFYNKKAYKVDKIVIHPGKTFSYCRGCLILPISYKENGYCSQACQESAQKIKEVIHKDVEVVVNNEDTSASE